MITFQYPDLLWGFLAILIPIGLHFVSRFNKKRIIFPSIFLFETQIKEVHRTFRFSDSLLLLLRLSVFSILILFFSDPVCTDQPTQTDENQPTSAVLFLLDNSLSMVYRDQEDLLFQAKNLIHGYLDRMPKGTFAAIVPLAPNYEQDLSFTDNRSRLSTQLNLITINDQDSLKNETLQKSIDSFTQTEYHQKSMVWISNFQMSNWSDIQVSSAIPIFYNQIGEGKRNQIAIQSVYTHTPFGMTHKPFTLQVSVQSYLPADKDVTKECYLQIFAERQSEKKYKEVSTVPDTPKKLVFEKRIFLNSKIPKSDIEADIQLHEEGVYRLSIQIDDPHYDLDNAWYVTIPIFNQLNILMLGRSDLGYVEKALESALVSQEERRRGWIRVDTVPTSKDYDALMVYRLASLSIAERNKIATFIRNKKPVLFLYCNQDSLQDISLLWHHWKIFEGIQLESIQKGDFYPVLDQKIESNHFFSIRLRNVWHGVLFNSYARINYGTLSYFPILRHSSGDTLLIRDRHDPFYFFNADPSFNNSNITKKHAFPLLVRSILEDGIHFSLEKVRQETKDLTNPTAFMVEQGKCLDYSMEFIRTHLFPNTSVQPIQSSANREENLSFQSLFPSKKKQDAFETNPEATNPQKQENAWSLFIFLVLGLFMAEFIFSTFVIRH